MGARTDSAESTTPKGRPRIRTRLTRLSTEQVLAAALEIVDREAPTPCRCAGWRRHSSGTR